MMEPAALIRELLARRAERPREQDASAALGLTPNLEPKWWGTHFTRMPTSPSRGTPLTAITPLFYDGLVLASLLTGKPAGGPHPLANSAYEPFWRRAATQSPKLRDGPLATVALGLIDAVIPHDPRDDRERIVEAGFVMLTLGILLHHRIHGVIAPALVDLVPQRRAAIASARTVSTFAWGSPDAEPFLDQILAAPDDDGPRLVFADWLSERDDLRGELVTAQCQFETARGAKRVELAERADALIAEHGLVWERAVTTPLHIGKIARWPSPWHRGFVHGTQAEADSFFQRYDEFVRYPLRRVKLIRLTRPVLVALASSPTHPTLDAIDLGTCPLNELPAALASPFFARVQSLQLGHNRLGPDAITNLGCLPSRRLRTLDLGGSALTTDAVVELCEAACMQTVEELRLHDNALVTNDVLEALARLPRLKLVDLERTAVTPAAAARYPHLHAQTSDPA